MIVKYFKIGIIFCLFFLLNACDNHAKKTELMQAAAQGNLIKAQQLAQEKIQINQQDQIGMTALLYAIMNNRPEIVKYLLANGADANSATKTGNSALIIASTVGNPDIIKMLHEKGAEINHANQKGITALMAAAGAGKIEIIPLLLSYGADPCMKDSNHHDAFQTVEQWWGTYEAQQAIARHPSLKKIICSKEING